MARLPLEGIRICDFTWVWAGPYDTMLLAMMGAEVIKIESSQRPDVTRRAQQMAMQAAQQAATQAAQQAASVDPQLAKSNEFGWLNLCKKSCTLNLRQSKGVELVKEIVKISDVVAENFSTGTMERLGLGYSLLREIKPDIIMISTSIPGRTGPRNYYTGYAVEAHALSGAAAFTGYPEGPPRHPGNNYGDLISATHGAFAVLAALYHRAKTGESQHIDLSMTEVMVNAMSQGVMDYVMNGRVLQRQGNRDDFMAPHGCYRCRGDDKWVAIAISNDSEWSAFCRAIGQPEWTKDERFADGYSRWANQKELDKLVGSWTKDYTPYEVMEILQRSGVAAGPSVNVEELVNDRQLRQRGFFIELEHPNPETEKGLTSGAPWKLSALPDIVYERAPRTGEHNDYVFRELLGLSEEEVAQLKEEQVII